MHNMTKKILNLQGMEDPSFINPWYMNSLDEISMLPLAAALGENLQQSHSHLYSNFNLKASMDGSHIGTVIDRPVKHHKPNSWNSTKVDPISNPLVAYSPNFLSFVSSNYTNQMGLMKPKEEAVCLKGSKNPPSDGLVSQGSYANQDSALKANQGAKRVCSSTRLPQTQDHIVAERKRREKLSQRFIALSAIVPGLKKVQNNHSLSCLTASRFLCFMFLEFHWIWHMSLLGRNWDVSKINETELCVSIDYLLSSLL